MALQWMILTYVVAAEAVIALLLTLPSPKAIKSTIVSFVSLILQPALFIVPFASFQLLGLSSCFLSLFDYFFYSVILTFRDGNGFVILFVDIYWKKEHRLMCTSEICTASERDRFEKSVIFFFFSLTFLLTWKLNFNF